jgi:hypothetical protein
MPTSLDEQAAIDRKIAENVIGSIPETWDRAILSVERSQEGDIEALSITITNPDGLRDIVMPDEELFDLLRSLLDCFAKRGTVWKRVVYSLSRTGEDWNYKASFSY